VDALYPRVLTARFAESYRFYAGTLGEVVGAELARGGGSGPYASWDLEGEGLLALLDRKLMADVDGEPDAGAGAPASVMLVLRVADVDAALAACERHGGVVVTPARDRPEWGPGVRTAHVRDPDGNLVELQSY